MGGLTAPEELFSFAAIAAAVPGLSEAVLPRSLPSTDVLEDNF